MRRWNQNRLVDALRQLNHFKPIASPGLYGRTVVTFEPNPITYGKDAALPSHNITIGDIVAMGCGSFDKKELKASGVVIAVRKREIKVAFDELDVELDDSNSYYLVKIANDVTYRRLKLAINNLKQNRFDSRADDLRDLLFDKTTKLSLVTSDDYAIKFFNEQLDHSQRDAVKFALAAKHLAIVHGPPGTGKTTTLIEIIRQCVKSGLKVLACAPSNIAVDNILERLVACKDIGRAAVRLGHPARAASHLQPFSLDAAILRSDQKQLVNDIRQEMDNARSKRHNSFKELRKELREREHQALQEVLLKSKVVLSTLTSASCDGPLKAIIDERSEGSQFDVLVVDECSQATESAVWIPLNLAPKLIIAGDHLQLPPTIISKKAAKDGLEVTLMERLICERGHELQNLVRMLTVQYRMHQDIMEWSSRTLYDNKLEAHESVREHKLEDLNPKFDQEEFPPLVCIDTAVYCD